MRIRVSDLLGLLYRCLTSGDAFILGCRALAAYPAFIIFRILALSWPCSCILRMLTFPHSFDLACLLSEHTYKDN